jgi:hypothetical protein
MRTTKHVLRMSCGVAVEMTFNEQTAQMDCEWTPGPRNSLQEDRENSRGIQGVAERDSDGMGTTEEKKVMPCHESARLAKAFFGLSH